MASTRVAAHIVVSTVASVILLGLFEVSCASAGEAKSLQSLPRGSGYYNPRDRSSYASGYPASGTYAAAEPGLLEYVLPALVITGLSLLFPNVITINSRKRRGAAEGGNPMMELAAQVAEVYHAAVESDECMQRLACEVGAKTNHFHPSNKNLMVGIMGKATDGSSKYSKLYQSFKNGSFTAKCEDLRCSVF